MGVTIDRESLVREQVQRRFEQLAELAPKSMAAHAMLMHKTPDGRPIIPARHHLEWIRIAEDIKNYRWVVIVAPPGFAKLLADDTPMLTTDGWTTHGDLREGDYVFSPSGEPVQVLATWRWETRERMRVVFSDRSSIVADANHEWEVLCDRERYRAVGRRVGPRGAVKYVPGTRPHRRVREILETKDLLIGQRRPPAIEVAAPPQFTPRSLPVDPYLFGLWLGNGDSASGRLTMNLRDVDHYRHLSDRIREDPLHGGCSFSPPGLTSSLKRAGLLGNKHIPPIYFVASIEQRLALLQGLMNTDGTVNKTNGHCEYSTTDPRLRDDVYRLVCHLGHVAGISEGRAMLNGVDHGPCWKIGFTGTTKLPPVTVPFKANRLKDEVSPRTRRRFVVAVEPTEPMPGQCISVEGGLYVAGENLITTHNSTIFSVIYPSWEIGRTGGRVCIGLVSNTASLTYGFSTAIMQTISSSAFQEVYGIGPNPKRWAKPQFWTNGSVDSANPTLMATGIGGPIQGKRYDTIILDDPTTWDEARSKDTMEKQRHWLKALLLQRFPPGMGPPDGKGRMVCVLTRWGASDLVPTLAEVGFKIVTMPALGYWDRVEHPDGTIEYGEEPLWPEVASKEQLLKEREDDELIFELVKQGNPRVMSGDVFNPEWFQKREAPGGTDPREIRPYFQQVVQYVDTAGGKDRKRGDFFAMATVGLRKDSNEVWILDMQRGRIPAPEQEDTVKSEAAEWDPDLIVIEDKNEGTALYQRMIRSTRLPLRAEAPTRDKEFRTIPLANAYKAMIVFHPAHARWRPSYEAELATFPNGPNDDQVDAAAGAFNATGTGGPRLRVLSKSASGGHLR